MDKEMLHVRYAMFCHLVEKYHDIGMGNESVLYHLSIFLGKYAFDHACSHQLACKKITEGVNVGRQWSIDAFEAKEC